MSQNIILIGMMGSGKTTLGKWLSTALNLKFIDTDHIIEEMQGQSIRQIFDRHGVAHFRQLEAALIEKLSGVNDSVLATGGGIILNPNNNIALRQLGTVIYLRGSTDQLVRNVSLESDSRPLLNLHNLETILMVREKLYEGTAHYVVDIDHKSIETIGNEISTLMGR